MASRHAGHCSLFLACLLVSLSAYADDDPVAAFASQIAPVLSEAVEAAAESRAYRTGLTVSTVTKSMLDGFVAGLGDPYAAVVDREELGLSLGQSDGQSSTGRRSGDSGLILDGDEYGRLTVASVLPGSPAEAVGLRVGERILRIHDTNASSLAPWEALAAIRVHSESGAVRLVVENDAGALREVVIAPREFTVRSVTLRIGDLRWGRFREHQRGRVAWVRIHAFLGESTQDEWNKAVADIWQTPSIETLILDLRDNGGGDNSNLRMLGDLLPQGKPLVTFEAVVGDSGWREHVRNGFIPRGRLISYPAAVLVNRNTASLAEIFAAALQDVRQLTIVGERTRGKGTTQTWLTVGERYAIHLTVGRWRSAHGRSIDGIGIEPDLSTVGGSDALLSAALKAIDRRRSR